MNRAWRAALYRLMAARADDLSLAAAIGVVLAVLAVIELSE